MGHVALAAPLRIRPVAILYNINDTDNHRKRSPQFLATDGTAR